MEPLHAERGAAAADEQGASGSAGLSRLNRLSGTAGLSCLKCAARLGGSSLTQARTAVHSGRGVPAGVRGTGRAIRRIRTARAV